MRAACLVDADVECEFRPSLETVEREEAQAIAVAEAALKEAKATEAAAEKKAEAAYPWC